MKFAYMDAVIISHALSFQKLLPLFSCEFLLGYNLIAKYRLVYSQKWF